jgi:hypothetical protein
MFGIIAFSAIFSIALVGAGFWILATALTPPTAHKVIRRFARYDARKGNYGLDKHYDRYPLGYYVLSKQGYTIYDTEYSKLAKRHS